MNLKGVKINFIGDSITEGHGTSAPEHRFTEVIARETGALCRNYGVGATRFARQITEFPEFPKDQDFCARFAQMDPDADAVVVFGGTNDFGHGDAPLGTMEDRTSGTFYGALHVLCTGLIERYPAADIVLLTPLHRCNEDSLRGDGFKAQDVGDMKTYVAIMREVAEYYALPVLDLFAGSGLQPKVPVIRERYMPDGLHLNDAGHRVLARKLIRFLEAL